MDRVAIHPAARPRALSLALACSAIAHLVAAMAVSPAPRSAAAAHGGMPLTARLVPQPPPVPAPELPDANRLPAPAPAASPVQSRKGKASRVPTASTSTRGTKATPASPVFDPVYYAAAELDEYPRALDALPRAGSAGAAAPAAIRLELFIDEHGVVTRIARMAPAAGDAADARWQRSLAATRFAPARRDGRVVRSRVIVSIGPAAQTGAR